MKNGLKIGIPLAIIGVLASTQSVWGFAILLAGLIMIIATLNPMIKKYLEKNKKVTKYNPYIDNSYSSNATQTVVGGGMSMVNGLIAVMIATIIGIGVVIPVVSGKALELNSTSTNPAWGTVVGIMPTLVIIVVLVAIVGLVSGISD